MSDTRENTLLVRAGGKDVYPLLGNHWQQEGTQSNRRGADDEAVQMQRFTK